MSRPSFTLALTATLVTISLGGCATTTLPAGAGVESDLSGEYVVTAQSRRNEDAVQSIAVYIDHNNMGIAGGVVRLDGKRSRGWAFNQCGDPGENIRSAIAERSGVSAVEVIRCSGDKEGSRTIVFLIKSKDHKPIEYRAGLLDPFSRSLVANTGRLVIVNLGSSIQSAYAIESMNLPGSRAQ